MIYKCEICEEGEDFQTKNLLEMVKHLELHCKNSEMLINKIMKELKK